MHVLEDLLFIFSNDVENYFFKHGLWLQKTLLPALRWEVIAR